MQQIENDIIKQETMNIKSNHIDCPPDQTYLLVHAYKEEDCATDHLHSTAHVVHQSMR